MFVWRDLCILLLVALIHGQQVFVNEPRLVSQDGNLEIFAGYNKNITLGTFGEKSCINIGPYNVMAVLQDAINASRSINRVTNSLTIAQESFNALSSSELNGPRGVLKRLSDLERGRQNLTRSTAIFRNRSLRQLRSLVNALRRRVTRLETRLNLVMNVRTVGCSSTPCQHGGTCIDTIKGFKCLCPHNWEGPECATDVDECIRLAGTDLGCQNGAACNNTPGSYECRCSSGWFGLHCTKRSNDCTSSPNEEICGHGICVPQSNAPGFKCICEQGWTTKDNNPSCTQDVDECQGNHYPCSVTPMVPCVNTPGSFGCGSCPAGYSGNGYYCTDIDECFSDNGGCSTNPKVDCINTLGSRACGPCPVGYQGNGILCTFVGVCQINNGGCHVFADCIANPMISPTFVQCQCRVGYQGSGYGPMGCVPSTGGAVVTLPPNAILESHCAPNPCLHGTCQLTPAGRKCICDVSYTGTLCDQLRDPCIPQPCLNGGTCIGDMVTFGYRCECTSQYTGPNCNAKVSACGGVKDMPEGRIVYPDSNSTTYTHNSRCAWVIVTQSNKVLNVTFTRFNLEMSSDCLYDWLQIHDGQNSASHYIGRFCGNTLPMGGNIVSTRNFLYLWFRSDHTVSKNGFEMSWTSIDPICGEHINVSSHGVIKSPGSPGKYPNDRDCTWILSAPIDKKIQLHFYTMQIETSANCEHDYISIFDSDSLNETPLVKYCGSVHPPPLTIESSLAMLYFHSDSSNNDFGFQISYALLEGQAGCGITYTQSRGEITPPKMNGFYVNDVSCEYRLNLMPGTVIRLTFLEFSLETSSSCQFDSVTIYDGESKESRMIGKYCGTELPPTLMSSSNKVLIVFKADTSFAGEGFKILYEELCYRLYEGPSGIIKSPGYPKTYPSKSICSYTIKSSPGTAIVLNFIDFDIEQPSFTDCVYDYLKIYDSDIPSNSSVIGKYCGPNDMRPPEIISSHNFLYMEFVSDVSIGGTGFQINYTTIQMGCGGLFKEMSGAVEHPDSGTDAFYENNKYCKWILSAPEGYVIVLTKNTFDLEEVASCSADYIEISNNNTRTGDNEVIGRFCGSEFPASITSTSNVMTILFVSDTNQVANGFSLHYAFSDIRKVCGGTYISSSGVITSPGWPNQYSSKKDCTWIIRAPEGQQIALNISKFELEHHSSCVSDYLEIRNGGFAESPLIGKYCGNNIPLRIPSMTNSLFLHFHSDFSRNYMGFYMTWDSTSTGCGGVLTSSRGSIISPNYPNKYNHNAECYWRITTSAGSKIQLMFATLDLETSVSCIFDNVEIYDGIDSSAKKIGRYCSLELIHSFILSTSNHVIVKFHTDSYTGGTGFMLNYNTVCNANLTDLSGTIESPNFPDNYPDNIDCFWNITAPKGNKINITFSHFELETQITKQSSIDGNPTTFKFHPSLEMWRDFLELKDGIDSNYTRRYAGNKLPPLFHSSDNKVFIHFHTDYLIRYSGFRLEWAVDGCGGFLRRPFDTFTSPGYPILYPHDTECQWTIEVEQDRSIELKIVDMDIEGQMDCNMDYVQIYNGPTDKFPLLKKACGNEQSNSDVVTSTNNYLFVKFHSDTSVSSRGFKATYQTIAQRCGGSFIGANGAIASPDYPKNYGNGLECLYYLEVPQYHTMVLSFTDLDLVQNEKNCSDYIKVYDGPTVTSNLVGTYCGTEKIEVIHSTSNKMVVEFKTDDSDNSKGFSANYTTECGLTIRTSTEGVVSIKQSTYYKTENCTWKIISDKLDEKVSLTFTYMDLDEDENCTYNNVEILDGDSLSSPLIGSFCGKKSPPMLVSHGNAMTVHLVRSFMRSFNFHYSVMKTACGGNLTSEKGEFTSPQYPDFYPPNANCIWFVNVSPGSGITLTFSTFKLGQSSSNDCEEDYVEVREEDGVGRLIGAYCNDTPPVIKSSKRLWIKFSSDGEGSDQGFVAEYSYDSMHEIVQMEMGELTSPLYPNPVRQPMERQWRIIVPPGSYILLTFKQFHFPKYGDSCFDLLEIFDGYSEDSPSLLSSCGNKNPDSITSSANVLYIKFAIASFSFGGSYFRLEWIKMSLDGRERVSIASCGGSKLIGIEPGEQYSLTSPGYPEGYNNSMNCEWIFETSPMQHLVLKFIDVSLEESEGCFDKIMLYDGEKGSENWKEVGSPICQPNATMMDDIILGNLLKVTFNSDVSVNKSGFSAIIFSDCGSKISHSSGIITPKRPRALRFGPRYLTDCQWDVRVRNGRTLLVEIIELNITNINDVCNTYIMLRNGGSSDSPLLGKGKYCESLRENENNTMSTSSNKLHVTYHLPSRHFTTLTQNTFKLRYSEVTLPCGDKITLDEDFNRTEITSPNYPNIPHPYSECSWVFVGQAIHRLTLDFIDRFDLSISEGCQDEYVEVRDGGTELGRSLGKFCKKPINTIKSTSNMLFLKFFTGIAVPNNGFKARISLDICGGTIYGTKGMINSPSTLSLAFVNGDVTCEWRIVGPNTHVFHINLFDIELPSSNNCTTSFVRIYDNLLDPITNITGSPVTPKICGSSEPLTVLSPSNEAILRFYISKAAILRDTFKFTATFNTSEEKCGGDYSQSSGFIELPRIQNMRRGCEWRITVPEGRRVSIEFMGTDGNEDKTFSNNNYEFWIGMFNGHTMDFLLAHFVKTINITKPIESSGNKMMVAFWGRPKSSSLPPFKLFYSSDQPSVCEESFSGNEGEIKAPSANMSRIYCEYPYKVSDGSLFNGTLEIEPLIESSNNICDSPMMRFQYNVYLSVSGIGRLTNLCPKKTFLSPYRDTVINIQKQSVSIRGYGVRYKRHDCGGIINDIGDGMNIFSLPANRTGPLRCVWLINNVPNGQILQLKPNAVVFNSKSCDSEYLQIRLGRNPKAFVSNKLCYNHIPDLIPNLRQQFVWIEYVTESFTTNVTLNISLSVSSEDKSKWWYCGGELNWLLLRDRTFSSPNFPSQYAENKECEWTLSAEEGYRVSLSFENRFFLESSPNCTKDYVEISDLVFDKWIVIGRYCGRILPPIINSTAERLKVLFHSDDSNNADGFQARWSLFCGGKLFVTAEEQRLKSPGKGIYGRNLDCIYELVPSTDETYINLQFEYFVLEASSTRICKYDNLSISSQSDFHPEVFCGTNSPGYKRLDGPVILRFMTDKWVQKKGYSLIYSLDNCGRLINKSGEIITSSQKGSKHYVNTITCKWKVIAPQDRVIVLSFRSFILEYHSECDHDFVEIYEKNDTSADNGYLLSKLCGNLTFALPVFKTKSNQMTIIFSSDFTLQYEGFVAGISFTYDENHGCGGLVKVTSTPTPLHIFSDKSIYEPHLDCHWIFKAPLDHTVNLRFTEFNVSKCFNSSSIGNCECDFLEIRDGLSFNSELIGRYCGDDLPENITSSKNYLFLRFVSDGTVQSSGVQIYASSLPSLCGSVVLNVTSNVQTLESPGYSGLGLPTNTKCEWLLSSGDKDNIHVRFNRFDIGVRQGSGNDCNTEFLQIISRTRENKENIVAHPLVKDSSMYSVLTPLTRMQVRKTLCGKLDEYEEYIFNSRVQLRLVTSSSSSTRHKGFKLSYSTIDCSRNFTKGYGMVMSEYFENGNKNCQVKIMAPENYTIAIYVQSFISDSSGCSDGYIEILDGITESSTSLAKYCDDVTTSGIYTNHNTATIHFVNQNLMFYNYMITYHTTDKGRGCGGNILDHSGQLMSPFYPETYRENNDCQWVISSPYSTITITFEIYDVGTTNNCLSNYVELVDRDGITLVKYCTRNKPAPFTVLNQYVKIIYHTSMNNYGAGWLLTFS